MHDSSSVSQILAIGLIATVGTFVHSGEPPLPSEAVSPDQTVVAYVNDQPISAYELDRALKRTFGNRQIAADAYPAFREKALDQLIDQRLIVEFAKQRKQFASEADFQQAWQHALQELSNKGTTLDQYLASSGRTEAEMRHAIWWQLAWESLLAHYQTEASLEKYFERQRSEFDGTKLRIAQIFFKLQPNDSAEAIESTRSYADQIRQQIASGALEFAEAARKHSQAPSASEGGEIGWIERHRPMPEPISKAAFALKQGEISKPIVTSLGVHILLLQEVKPGKGTCAARFELEQALQQYLFAWAANIQRPQSNIKRVTP